MKKELAWLVAIFITVNLPAQQLKQVWATGRVFSAPESLIYDEDTRLLYVSNINGRSGDKDSNGFISRLHPDGLIRNLYWIVGLHAPKGMAIYGARLYVADIDQLIEIDIHAGKILNRYPVPGAIFLNDVSVSVDGRVFISDSRANKIFMWQKGRVSQWLEDKSFEKVNGLWAGGKYLYIGSTVIHRVNLRTRRWKIIQQNAGGIDGLVRNKRGDFIFSHWAGRIIYRKKKKLITLIDTSADKINTADIAYAKDIDLLLVPTFYDNRVLAYRLE